MSRPSIVAASLPYVAGKFGGSTHNRKLPSTTHASLCAEDGKELSTLYFPGDERAQSSLAWPSFHHSNTVRVALESKGT